jgi:hypothetical protein
MKKSLDDSWYSNLIDDIKLQESTGIVATKHAIGKRILLDFEKFGKPEYGEKRVSSIAQDCGVSKTEIAKCIKFAKIYPELTHIVCQLPWRQIRDKLLIENPKEKTKEENWFYKHTNSDLEAFTLKSIIRTQQQIEKRFGVVYLTEFNETIQRILELGVTHLNYKQTWNQ